MKKFSRLAFKMSPFHIFLILIFSIFVGETLIMLFIEMLPPLPRLAVSLIDAILLSVLVLPVIYVFIYHPFTTHITERKQADEALRESEERFRKIFEEAHMGIVITSPSFAFERANPAFCLMTGYSVDELHSMTFADITHPDHLAQDIENVKKVGRGEIPFYQTEKRYIDKSGKVLWGSVIVQSIRDEHGTLLYYLSMVSDITDRKLAESKLIYISKAVESTSDAIGISDPLGRHYYQNKALSNLFGYATAEELEAAGGGSAVVKDMAVAKEMFDNIMSGKSWSGELEMVTKSGRVFPAFERADAIKDNEGNLIGLIGIISDISERKQAEDALRIFKESVDNSSDAIGLSTPEGRHYYQNKAFDQLFGTIGEHPPETVYVDKEVGVEVFRTVMSGGQWMGEVRMYAKDRQIRNVLLQAYSNKDEHGNITALVGIHTDITERKRADEERREKDLRYRTLFDKAIDGIFLIDLEGRILDVNESFAQMHGYAANELLDKSLSDLDTPETAKLIPERIKRIIEGEALNFEVEHYHKDGHIFQLNVAANRVEFNGNAYILCFHRDMTRHMRAEEEKRNLQERLQRAEKMEALGQLAGGVAHDLNNVLGVLTGYSELLLGEIPEGQRTRGYAERILQSTEKGAAIIQDLLTLARRGVTVSDVINLNAVVSDFLKTPVFERMKDYHPRVTFRMECDPNLLNIKGSLVHLEKTLINLVSNAAEAISGVGEVTIRTESCYIDKPIRGYDEVREGDYALLNVSDTGTGIPAEIIEKIFEPFYTKKTMGRSGTGLGLAIVWGTVKDHNGYIDVETEAERGTTFTLYFPVTREELIAEQPKEPIERYMGRGESVLVVDDIAEQREIAGRLLAKLGYEVHTASCGEEAIKYLKSNKADIMVLDMIMAPGIDGLETYRRVLEINPKQKAIIVSGFSETDRVRETQTLGAGAYVKKPYIMEKIGMAIRAELGKNK